MDHVVGPVDIRIFRGSVGFGVGVGVGVGVGAGDGFGAGAGVGLGVGWAQPNSKLTRRTAITKIKLILIISFNISPLSSFHLHIFLVNSLAAFNMLLLHIHTTSLV